MTELGRRSVATFNEVVEDVMKLDIDRSVDAQVLERERCDHCPFQSKCRYDPSLWIATLIITGWDIPEVKSKVQCFEKGRGKVQTIRQASPKE